MGHRISVFIGSTEYSILDAPERLSDADNGNLDFMVDSEQRVIWIGPSVSFLHRQRILVAAVSWAWRDRASLVPFVELTHP